MPKSSKAQITWKPLLQPSLSLYLLYPFYLGFAGGSVGKESTCNAGDTGDAGLIPGLGKSLGEGQGNPLQYSCQESPMDRGACWAIVHRVRVGHDWSDCTHPFSSADLHQWCWNSDMYMYLEFHLFLNPQSYFQHTARLCLIMLPTISNKRILYLPSLILSSF